MVGNRRHYRTTATRRVTRTLDPEKQLSFKWKPNEPYLVELKINNTLADRQTYKVKCTDNDIFRVRPPLGYVKAGETVVVKITLTSKTAPDSRHFFAIYHMKSDEEKKPARQAWTADSKAEGVARVMVQFEKEGEEKKDEKSDDKKDDKKDEKKDDKTDDKK